MPKAGCISGTRRSNRLRAILLNVLSVVPVVCLNAPCSGQAARRVTAVRFWSAGDTTRVAVEVSAEFKYKSDNLETPPRLFFDVQGAKPSMAQKTIPVGVTCSSKSALRKPSQEPPGSCSISSKTPISRRRSFPIPSGSLWRSAPKARSLRQPRPR